MSVYGSVVVIRTNGADGDHFVLDNHQALVGRSIDCDIQVELPGIAKLHCCLHVNIHNEVHITSLNFAHPTRLNGAIIETSERIYHMDLFSISDKVFRFEYPVDSDQRLIRREEESDNKEVITDSDVESHHHHHSPNLNDFSSIASATSGFHDDKNLQNTAHLAAGVDNFTPGKTFGLYRPSMEMEPKCDRFDSETVVVKEEGVLPVVSPPQEVLHGRGEGSSETSSGIWDDADSQVYSSEIDGGERCGEGDERSKDANLLKTERTKSVNTNDSCVGSDSTQNAGQTSLLVQSGKTVTKDDFEVEWADANDELDTEEHGEERWLDASEDVTADAMHDGTTGCTNQRTGTDESTEGGAINSTETDSGLYEAADKTPKCSDLSSSSKDDSVSHTGQEEAVQLGNEDDMSSSHVENVRTDNENVSKDTDREEDSSADDENDNFQDTDPGVAQALQDEQDKEGKEKENDKIEVDETARLEMEELMSWDVKQAKRDEGQEHKKSGNELFKNEEFVDAISAYTEGLDICPLSFKKERSIMYANRAASHVRLEHHDDAIEDCTKALALNPVYLKVFMRRAHIYELTDKLDEALTDYNTALELDPGNYEARSACMRLPDQIKERNEKLKEEMMGKLKDLGNLVLRPFGLSTENFQLQQDPNSGGYSVNFNRNPGNGN